MDCIQSHTDPQSVLIVDDRELADMYQQQLAAKYTTRTAYSGTQATEMLDQTVDVMLLDRRMLNVSGEPSSSRFGPASMTVEWS